MIINILRIGTAWKPYAFTSSTKHVQLYGLIYDTGSSFLKHITIQFITSHHKTNNWRHSHIPAGSTFTRIMRKPVSEGHLNINQARSSRVSWVYYIAKTISSRNFPTFTERIRHPDWYAQTRRHFRPNGLYLKSAVAVACGGDRAQYITSLKPDIQWEYSYETL